MSNLFDRVMVAVARRSPDTALSLAGSVPRFLREGMRNRAFRRTIRHAARNSPFYRQKFDQLGIQAGAVRHPCELGSFFTISDDLLNNPPEAFLCAQPQLALETAGTSGRHKRLFFRYQELESNARRGAFLGPFMGLCPSDRIICTFEYSFGLPALLVQRTLPYIGSFGMAVGDVDPGEILERMEEYQFNVVFATPPWIIRFTELAEQLGTRRKLKMILTAGDPMTENARRRVEEYWQTTVLIGYGSTEIGASLGIECRVKNGYHLNEFDFFVEIMDPDAEGYGEVVVTTLNRSTMPLIRYRTRDIARILEEPCACGFASRRLSRLLGRSDEIVIFPRWNLHPSYFEGIFKEIPHVSDDWQVAVRENNGKAILQFRIEPISSNGTANPEIAEQVSDAIRKDYQDLWKGYELGLFDLDFSFVEKGALRQGRKLKRLVDERGR